MGIEILTTEEAKRQIQERDHADAEEGRSLGFADEETLINLLEDGILLAGLTGTGRLTFQQGPNWDKVRG